MAYTVYTTERFDKEVERLNIDEQERVRKIFLQLKENPYTGDQIRYRFFREKRVNEKRIYYLVYDELLAVLMVAISNKKDQPETIDYIIKYFDEFRKYLRDRLMS